MLVEQQKLVSARCQDVVNALVKTLTHVYGAWWMPHARLPKMASRLLCGVRLWRHGLNHPPWRGKKVEASCLEVTVSNNCSMIGVLRNCSVLRQALGPKRMAHGFMRHSSTLAGNPQIHVHAIDSEHRYKFSLLSDPKYLGLGFARDPSVSDPDLFQSDKRYINLLQKVISKNIHNDFTFIVEAGMNPSTHMPIYDLREVPNYARIPEIENIFGYIQVDDKGKMMPGTYQENNMYRPCTGKSGLHKLSDYMHEEMVKECQNVTD